MATNTSAAPVAAPVDGIVTPEAVVLTFAEAGLGSRTLAFLLDLLVQGAIALGFFALLQFVLLDIESQTVAIILATIFGFLILFGYRAALETLWNGRTVGKAAMGLRVITVEGAPARFRHIAIRTALDFIDFWVTAGAGALVSVLVSRRSQRLGDLAAGTIVVRNTSAMQASRAYVFAPLAGWESFATSLDITNLTTEQYAVIRSFLTRATDLAPGARWALGQRLANDVAGVLGVPVPPNGAHEAYLIAVVAAFQRRTAVSTPPTASLRPTATPLPPPTGWRLPVEQS